MKLPEIKPEAQSVIVEYLTEKKMLGKSPLTIYSYRRILYHFFFDCTKDLEQLEREDIRQWIHEHYGDKKPRTIQNRISVLSSFFSYCLLEEYIDKSLISKFWSPKTPKSLPKSLDNSEYARVTIAAEKLSLRDRTIIEFLKSSGVRRAEIVDLSIVDLDLINNTAIVTGKGNKKRIVHFSSECAELLINYIAERINCKDQPIFLNRYGNRLSSRSIWNITADVGKRSGIKRHLGPHVFRHTYATRLLSKGSDMQFIAEELGHSNISTTRVYARLLNNDIRNLYQKYMG